VFLTELLEARLARCLKGNKIKMAYLYPAAMKNVETYIDFTCVTISEFIIINY
jgi:hypothetical protein